MSNDKNGTRFYPLVTNIPKLEQNIEYSAVFLKLYRCLEYADTFDDPKTLG